MATHGSNKIFKRVGGLAFPHYSYVADVSRLLMVRGVQLDWSGTKLIVSINPSKKLSRC